MDFISSQELPKMKLSANARRLSKSLTESAILMEAVIVRNDPTAYLQRVVQCLESQGYELPDVVETEELIESLGYILENDKRLVEFQFLKKAAAALRSMTKSELPAAVHKQLMQKHAAAANDAVDAIGNDIHANSKSREDFIKHHIAKFQHMKAHDPKRHYTAAKDAMNNGLPPIGTAKHASALWYMAQKMKPVIKIRRNAAPAQEFHAAARREQEKMGAEAGTDSLRAHDSHTQLTKSGGESKPKDFTPQHPEDTTGVLKITPKNAPRTSPGLQKSNTGTQKYGTTPKGNTKIFGK